MSYQKKIKGLWKIFYSTVQVKRSNRKGFCEKKNLEKNLKNNFPNHLTHIFRYSQILIISKEENTQHLPVQQTGLLTEADAMEMLLSTPLVRGSAQGKGLALVR